MEAIINSLIAGEITFLTSLLSCILALVFSAIGGAMGGIIIGGKHLGNDLAAMMGGAFGPIAAVPGVLLALIILFI